MKIEAILCLCLHTNSNQMKFMQHVTEKEKFVPATERSGNKRHVMPEKLLL